MSGQPFQFWTLETQPYQRPRLEHFDAEETTVEFSDDGRLRFDGFGDVEFIPLDAIKALIAAHEAWLSKQEEKL